MESRGVLVLVALAVMAFSPAVRAATPAEVATAIQKAKQWLYDHQLNGGNWDPATAPDLKKWGNDIAGPQFTGQTAFCTYALLCAGDSPSEPHVKSAIDFLKKNTSAGVYALSARCLVWSSINLDPATRAIALKDLQSLLRATRSAGPAKGMFYYTAPVNANDAMYDHSVSQFAVLAISAMEQKGFEIPSSFWKTADQQWRLHQAPDGGWPYMVVDKDPQATKITPNMTAAGVATLMITSQALGRPINCDPVPADTNVKKGQEWLSQNFERIFDRGAESFGGGYETYSLFGVSRIGVASGHSYLGKTDWFQRGSDFLVKTQTPEGFWHSGWLLSPQSATSFGLLFLSYGSAPVVVNKLRYATDATDGKTVESWNLRPRDTFNLVRWMGNDMERRLNWRAVDLGGVPVEDLLDAPILFLAGNKPLKFSEQDLNALRTYVHRGGMIVGNADCGSEEFSKSFVQLGTSLFPQFEFKLLQDDHPINARQTYIAAKFKKKIPLKALSNGVREVMVIPDVDLSKPLTLNDVNTQRESFQTWSNIVQYATNKTDFRQKGVSHVVKADRAIKPARTVRLARLQYAGNADPEPGGWVQFAAAMRNQRKVDLQIAPVELGTGKINEFPVAHLTGTEMTKFSEAQRAELKRYVDGGGTLIIDAAGGRSAFADSIEAELETIFGAEAKRDSLKVLPPEHLLYKVAEDREPNVNYRSFGRDRLPSGTKTPQVRALLKDNRLAVIYSREDLSAGLVGQNVDGVAGYDPASAFRVMRDIIEFVSPK